MALSKSMKRFFDKLEGFRAKKTPHAILMATIGFTNPSLVAIRAFLDRCPNIPGWAIDALLEEGLRQFADEKYLSGLKWIVDGLLGHQNKRILKNLSESKILWAGGIEAPEFFLNALGNLSAEQQAELLSYIAEKYSDEAFRALCRCMTRQPAWAA